MLGRYVSTYLKSEFETIELNRNELNCSSTSESDLTLLLKKYGAMENDVVINCVGTIKPMIDKLGDLNAILVNSVFPHILSSVCEKLSLKMIHPTTDCVFLGDKTMYSENDEHDIRDVYGRTKSLGEPKNCMVIRTSIIGEEINNKRSLVEWVKSQKDKNVNGFNNHFWNGITCLEWVKLVSHLIKNNIWWEGVRHISSPNVVTKFELLHILNEVYKLNLKIDEVSAKEPIDRTLTSLYKLDYTIPNLEIQIKEMRDFVL